MRSSSFCSYYHVLYSREYQVFTHNAFGSATLHAEKEMAPGGAGLGITWLPPSNAHSGLGCISRGEEKA